MLPKIFGSKKDTPNDNQGMGEAPQLLPVMEDILDSVNGVQDAVMLLLDPLEELKEIQLQFLTGFIYLKEHLTGKIKKDDDVRYRNKQSGKIASVKEYDAGKIPIFNRKGKPAKEKTSVRGAPSQLSKSAQGSGTSNKVEKEKNLDLGEATWAGSPLGLLMGAGKVAGKVGSKLGSLFGGNKKKDKDKEETGNKEEGDNQEKTGSCVELCKNEEGEKEDKATKEEEGKAKKEEEDKATKEDDKAKNDNQGMGEAPQLLPVMEDTLDSVNRVQDAVKDASEDAGKEDKARKKEEDKSKKEKSKPNKKETGKGVFGGILGDMGNIGAALSKGITDAITGLISSFSLSFILVIASIGLLVYDFFRGFNLAETLGVSKLSGVVGSIFGGGMDGGILNSFLNAGKWAVFGATIGSVVPVVGTLLGGIIGAVLGAIMGWFGAGAIADGIDTAIENLGEWFTETLNKAMDFSDMIDGLEDKLVGTIANFITGITTGIMNFVASLFEAIGEYSITLPSWLGGATIKPFSALSGVAKAIRAGSEAVSSVNDDFQTKLEDRQTSRDEDKTKRDEELEFQKKINADRQQKTKEYLAATPEQRAEMDKKREEENKKKDAEDHKMASDWKPGETLSDAQMTEIQQDIAAHGEIEPELRAQYEKQLSGSKKSNSATSEKKVAKAQLKTGSPAADTPPDPDSVELFNSIWKKGTNLTDAQMKEVGEDIYANATISPELRAQYEKQFLAGKAPLPATVPNNSGTNVDAGSKALAANKETTGNNNTQNNTGGNVSNVTTVNNTIAPMPPNYDKHPPSNRFRTFY